jgi:hypothetical protein
LKFLHKQLLVDHFHVTAHHGRRAFSRRQFFVILSSVIVPVPVRWCFEAPALKQRNWSQSNHLTEIGGGRTL